LAKHKKLDMIKDHVEYYDHQVDGIRQLAKWKSFLLADEMGLGKSLQSLAVVAIDFQMKKATHFLVVAPATLKGNWQEEIKEHTHFKSLVVDGQMKKRRKQIREFIDGDYDCLIVNYEQVIPHLEALNDINFDIIIYDEAHYIKTHDSARTIAIHGLKANRHFLLTGSPLLGHVIDLWSLFYRINNNIETFWRFRNRYIIFGGYKDKEIVGTQNKNELKERLESFMLRRLKEDWLDLPPKQYVKVFVDMNSLQQKLYDEVVDELKLSAPGSSEAEDMDIENALTKMIRLKQICGTPASITFQDDNGETYNYPDMSNKLDRVVEMCQDIVLRNKEHLVVFTQSRAVLLALQTRLTKKKVRWHTLHGDVPKANRRRVVDEWTEDQPAVMLAMIQVAGVGLTMTKASKCIMVDKLFVPMLMKQGEDRLHRIGADKTQPVQIFEMITRNSIEQRVEEILGIKNETFKDIVESPSVKKELLSALLDGIINGP
jgi:SNF2 family DNA or RNA helicase